VLAFLVVLVLAVGGLLLRRAAPARRVIAAGAGVSRGARSRARRRKISRDVAVRRSKIHASRAPGPLCERASGFHAHRADGRALRFAATPHLWGVGIKNAVTRALSPARSAPARC
jgi:hypothetical protein